MSSGNTILASTYKYLLKKDAIEVVGHGMPGKFNFFEKAFGKYTTQEYLEEMLEVSGFTRMSKLVENGEHAIVKSAQRGVKEIKPERYSLMFLVSYIAMQQNRVKTLINNQLRTKEVLAAAEVTNEVLATAVFNNCTSTADYNHQAIDGQALISTSRPTAGASYQNRLSVDMPFSMASIEQMEIDLSSKIRNSAGEFNPLNANKLVLHPKLVPHARRLMESDKEVGTANNDKNIYMGKYEIISSPYLTSETAHFLLTDEYEKALIRLERKGLETDISDVDFETDAFKSKSHFQVAYAVGHAGQGVYGTTGV